MRALRAFSSLLLLILFFALNPSALAKTTWYVSGLKGSDNNDCKSPQTACKTIGHAISLATSGDSIMIAAATYTENLTVGISLTFVGSGAGTTIIDGGGVDRVLLISQSSANVSLSKVTVRNGYALQGGGIYNYGTLAINQSIITANTAHKDCGSPSCKSFGGGIASQGTSVTLNHSSVIGNMASLTADSGSCQRGCSSAGAGIWGGRLVINSSTVSGNSAVFSCNPEVECSSAGGGVVSYGSSIISGSTISGNSANGGGGIENEGALTLTNSTVSGNVATNSRRGGWGGGILNDDGGLLSASSTIAGNSVGGAGGSGGGISGSAELRNSIVADNTVANGSGANCNETIRSLGYNLSNDLSCNFSGPGDLNNTDPMLSPLQNNGGPTETMALPFGSPAVDAGNPNGCTDGLRHLLKTDQRGKPRPDKEDTAGCDMGAYELQSD